MLTAVRVACPHPRGAALAATFACPSCPGTPCSCPPGRTICDNLAGPKVTCLGTSRGCVEHAGGGSVCYGNSAGVCFHDLKICSTDEDCEDQVFPGFQCVQTGACAELDCFETACVATCSAGSPDALPRIEVLTSPR